MSTLAELASLEDKGEFIRRHIGPSEAEVAAMLQAVGALMDEAAYAAFVESQS